MVRFRLHILLLCAVFAAFAVGAVFAAPPQSDNFEGTTLKPFWKTKQVIYDTAYPTPSYEVRNGLLILRSADQDVWMNRFEPYYIYQEGITGDFTVQLKVISVPQLNEWSHVGILVCSGPIPDSYTDPNDIPTWWLIAATRNRCETKGGGQGQSRSITTIEGIQPPYWIRLDRRGTIIRVFYSLDGGKTWEQVNDDIDMSAENVQRPFEDPLTVGIHMQTHAGQAMGEAVVASFQAGTIDQAGKLPGDAAAPAQVTGSVKDEKGNPVAAGTTVQAVSETGLVMNARTDADGNFRMFLDPGTYTFTVASDEYEVPGAQPVKIEAGKQVTQNLVVKPYPFIDLSSASTDTTVSVTAWGGYDDPTVVRPDNFDPAKPEFKETANWMQVDWPADLQAGNPVPNNSWFWYRIKFRIPDKFKQYKGQALFLSGFNCDDSDLTFVNGHFVGQMLWSWNTPRNYLVPSEFINWDGENVVAILGNQGGGGAGSQLSAGRLRVGSDKVGAIYGRVVSETGAGANRLTVEITDAQGNKSSTTTADADGSFRFTNLTPGTYKLTVSGRGAVALPDPVTLTVEGGKVAMVPELKITGAGFGPKELAPVDFASLKGQDINSSGGSHRVSGKELIVQADGADIWGNADEFYYAYLPNKISGDFTAVVRVLDVAQGGSDWSKAGIMVRETLDAGSRHVFAAGTSHHGARLQWRPLTDGASSDLGGDNWWRFGTWIMLTRNGDRFSLYKSEDGSVPALVAETTVANFPKDLFIGLAATSHASGDVRTARFTEFKLAPMGWEPAVAPPPPAVVKGDLNGDGRLGIPDVTIALQIAVGIIKPTPQQLAAGDLNGNGRIEIAEVTQMLRAAVGLGKL
jgi:regulation of enolase protein 1 (concanavalin A-like superfamily)